MGVGYWVWGVGYMVIWLYGCMDTTPGGKGRERKGRAGHHDDSSDPKWGGARVGKRRPRVVLSIYRSKV